MLLDAESARTGLGGGVTSTTMVRKLVSANTLPFKSCAWDIQTLWAPSMPVAKVIGGSVKVSFGAAVALQLPPAGTAAWTEAAGLVSTTSGVKWVSMLRLNWKLST